MSAGSSRGGYYFSPFRWIWIAAGLLLLALLAVVAVEVVYRGLYLGQPIPGRFFGGFFLFPLFGFGWLIVGILALGLILRLVFRPWRRSWYGYGYGYRRFDPAMQQLRERYARGEITREQFEQMTKDLQGQG